MAIKTTITASGRKRRRGIRTTGAICVGKGRELVGGLNEGRRTLGDYVFNLQTRKMAAKAKRKVLRERTWAYLDTTADFQLWYGDTPFGKPRPMTGRESMQKNRVLEEKFFLDDRPDVRLWRWHMVGVPRVSKGMTVDQHRIQKALYNAKKHSAQS